VSMHGEQAQWWRHGEHATESAPERRTPGPTHP
jgi:hypothetical protein